VANRLLHEPTIRLRGAGDARSHSTLQVARELFGLDEASALAAPAEDERGDSDNVRSLDRRSRGA